MFLSLHSGVDADGFFSGTISVHSLQVVSFSEGPGLGSVDCAPNGTVVVTIDGTIVIAREGTQLGSTFGTALELKPRRG